MPSSIHSYGARSTTSIATTRSRTLAGSRKVKLKWWERKPIIRNAIFTDLQKGSYIAAIYTLVSPYISFPNITILILLSIFGFTLFSINYQIFNIELDLNLFWDFY